MSHPPGQLLSSNNCFGITLLHEPYSCYSVLSDNGETKYVGISATSWRKLKRSRKGVLA
jgi:hypothetical protein